MAKAPGTPASTGLIHIKTHTTPANIEYQQLGGFGPWTRDEAIEAAKAAGVVGRSKPTKIWVQRPRENVDAVLTRIIGLLDASGVRYSTIYKEEDQKAGFGVYYLYGDKVVMEHTSDPESKVSVGGSIRLFPHVHIEVIPYANIGNADMKLADRVKAINEFKIFDDSGYSPTATRLVRLAATDPTLKDDKPKFNHHIYYNVP